MGTQKRKLGSPILGGFIALAIWMTISALAGNSKGVIVGGGWGCFLVGIVIGLTFMALTGRTWKGVPRDR